MYKVLFNNYRALVVEAKYQNKSFILIVCDLDVFSSKLASCIHVNEKAAQVIFHYYSNI